MNAVQREPRFVLISDVDYSVVAMDANAGSAAVEQMYSGLGIQMQQEFERILFANRSGAEQIAPVRAKYEEVAERYSIEMSDPFWSRALWAAKLGQSPSDAIAAEDVYWQGIGAASTLYTDTKLFVKTLVDMGVEIIFVSSSDSILKLRGDGLEYDPEHSAAVKTERIAQSGLLDIVPRDTTALLIGDPISKPDPEFWQCVVRERKLIPGHDSIFVLGDSLSSDLTGTELLQPAERLWLVRDENTYTVQLGITKVSSLTEALGAIQMRLET